MAAKRDSNEVEGSAINQWAQLSRCPSSTLSKNVRSSGGEIIAMMQSAKPWHRYELAIHVCIRRCHPARRRRLVQREMRSVVMIVTDVLGHKPFQVSLVEHDHVVQKVSTTVMRNCRWCFEGCLGDFNGFWGLTRFWGGEGGLRVPG